MIVFLAVALSSSPALDALLKQAEKDLHAGPFSVMHKRLAPSSGDKHDYMSVGPYWWPDPTKPNGLPYIRKDGERNPERYSNETDSTELHDMFGAVTTLALAYRETGREEFAVCAADLLRGWFLDPATRMNPNLNFGQAVPGRVEGRGTGIIDTAGLVELTRACGMLAKSPAWPERDQAAMKQWAAGYLEWLQTSKNGKEEAAAENNHGTWYDAQVVSLALFVGRNDLAKRVLEAAKNKRISSEIEPDGRQPKELARTKSLGYSVMNLRAFFELATMGDQVGIDLWNFKTKDGRGLRAALDYIAPYVDESKKWPHDELGGVTKGDRMDIGALLRRASIAYHQPRYEEMLSALAAADVAAHRMQLLWPTRQ